MLDTKCNNAFYSEERRTIATRQNFWLIFDNFWKLSDGFHLTSQIAITVGGGDVNCRNSNVELDISASHISWSVETKAIWKLSKRYQKVVKN